MTLLESRLDTEETGTFQGSCSFLLWRTLLSNADFMQMADRQSVSVSLSSNMYKRGMMKPRDTSASSLCSKVLKAARNFICHNLDVCHIEARDRHVPGELVKTSATVAIFDFAIRTDLDSLFTPSFLPQSGTSLRLQYRWQTRGCRLQRNDVVDEDEGDTPAW